MKAEGFALLSASLNSYPVCMKESFSIIKLYFLIHTGSMSFAMYVPRASALREHQNVCTFIIIICEGNHIHVCAFLHVRLIP